MVFASQVSRAKEVMARLSLGLSIALHDAVLFFLDQSTDTFSIEKWELFEHFIRRVTRLSLYSCLQSQKIEGMHFSIKVPEPMLIKKTDLKIQINGMETVYLLVPYELLCQFIVVCEAKYRQRYSKRLAYELIAFDSKADYVLYQRSRALLSHLHRTSLFCGLKYVVTSFNLPSKFSHWLLSCGVIPITPNFSLIQKIGHGIDDWKFVLSISNFNRVIGKPNMFVPYQWQVHHMDTFYGRLITFIGLLEDRQEISFPQFAQRDSFPRILRKTALDLHARKRIRERK